MQRVNSQKYSDYLNVCLYKQRWFKYESDQTYLLESSHSSSSDPDTEPPLFPQTPGPSGGMRTSRVIRAGVWTGFRSLRTPAVHTEVAVRSGVLTLVTAASGTVGAALEPVHDVLQVSAVAAALAPHEQSLHHMVADGTYTGTLATPGGERSEVGSRQNKISSLL